MIATHLLYHAAGRPAVESLICNAECCLCGTQITQGVPRDTLLRDTFMDYDKCASPTSKFVCPACAWSFSEQVDLGREKLQRLRNYSHFVVKGEWFCLSKGYKRILRALLLNPPADEWLGVVAESGQKHIIFRAPIAVGSVRPTIQFEEHALTYSPTQLAALLNTVDALYQVFTKNEIERGDYRGALVLQMGLENWNDLESVVSPARGSALLALALFLSQKEDEVEELKQQAADLLLIVHLSMNWSVWGEKRLKYWDIFQENVAASAYTDDLAKWLNTLCARMSILTPGRNEKARTRLEEILNGGQDKVLLKLLREETQLLVLMVRVAQQQKKTQWEKEDQNAVAHI